MVDDLSTAEEFRPSPVAGGSDATADTAQMREWFSQAPDTESVARFVPGPGIQKLQLRFDIDELREALSIALERTNFQGMIEEGFGAFSLTRRPGMEKRPPMIYPDCFGRVWMTATKKCSVKNWWMSMRLPNLCRCLPTRTSSMCMTN